MQSISYWTSTTVSINTINAWIIEMAFGYAGFDSHTNDHSLWPVRGGH